ncbi:MAG: hypothetical protein GWP08_02375 [Nitrospiraceae bacterium]|nr:hypothetical protein [Nitrospiraceae bacterium]
MGRITIAGAVMLAVAQAWAEPTAKAFVDRQTVGVGVPFALRIETNGDIDQVKLPEAPGLEIDPRSPSRSRREQWQFGGGRRTRIVTVEAGYRCVARQEGRITIPPIEVTVAGTVVHTQPVLLNVIGSGRGPSPARTTNTRQAQAVRNAPDGAPQRQLTWDDTVFLESEVDKQEVYQGEPIALTLRLGELRLRGLSIKTVRGAENLPSTEGFYATSPVKEAVATQYNGYPYEVTVIQQTLYPMATGALQVGAWHWEGVGSEGVFGPQHALSEDVPPIDITVKPLPPRPADFSGAVGRLSFRAELLSDRVIQGVPTTLVVSIRGRTNPDAIAAPKTPEIDGAFVSDPDKQMIEVDTPEGPGVEKSFSYTITPLEAGELHILPISFCYFDPVEETYKTASSQAFVIQVTPSVDSGTRVLVTAGMPSTPGAVAVLGEDILPPCAAPGDLRRARTAGASTPAVLATPVIAYCGLALFMRRRRRFERDIAFARDHRAKAIGHKRLRGVARADAPAQELYKAVTGFIADKFNVAPGGMTSSDAERLLVEAGADSNLIEGFRRILRACERAQYGGTQLSEDEVGALTSAAGNVIDTLDALLKKGRGR